MLVCLFVWLFCCLLEVVVRQNVLIYIMIVFSGLVWVFVLMFAYALIVGLFGVCGLLL